MERYSTRSRGLYVYLINEGFTKVTYHQDRQGSKKVWWSWEVTDELNEAIKRYFKRGGYAANRKFIRTHTVLSPWLVEELSKLGYEALSEEPDIYDWRKTVWQYTYSDKLLKDIDWILTSNGNSNIDWSVSSRQEFAKTGKLGMD